MGYTQDVLTCMMVGDQPGVLLIRFGSIKPVKGGVGVGSTVLSGNWVAAGEPGACARAPFRRPKLANAVASAALAVDRNNCRRFIGVPLLIDLASTRRVLIHAAVRCVLPRVITMDQTDLVGVAGLL
jgi:hypothetical protein